MQHLRPLSSTRFSYVLSPRLAVGGRRCLNKEFRGADLGLRWKSAGKKDKYRRGAWNFSKSKKAHKPPKMPKTTSTPSHLKLSQPQGHLDDHAIRPTAEGVLLDREQKALVDLILTGRNVFYTGAAGTGKSIILHAAVKRLRQLGRRVEVIAPTGRSALAVNGLTTSSYAGWGPNAHAQPLSSLQKWSTNKKQPHRFVETDVLIINEVNMIENIHLERLSEVMKRAKGLASWPLGWQHAQKAQNSAFGGCQVIATGDFFQLPPISPFRYCFKCGSRLRKKLQPRERIYRCPKGHGSWPESDKWAFQSDAWEKADFAHVELGKVYPQTRDRLFIGILNRLRSGRLTHDDIMTLMDPNRKIKDLTNAVRLYSTYSEVVQYNADRLRELQTTTHAFAALDRFFWNKHAHPHLLSFKNKQNDGTLDALQEHKYESSLRLRVGMPVILLSNLSIRRGLVNGSQGIVIDFVPINVGDMLLRMNKSRPDPKDAYITTIVENELLRYVELLTRILIPVVQFDNGVTEVIYPQCSDHEVGHDMISIPIDLDKSRYNQDQKDLLRRVNPSVLCRTQIPLSPGWAMSLNNAQYMTLDKVIVDLTKLSEASQIYIALSRAKSLDGIKIEGDPQDLLVRSEGWNREVKQYYQEKFGNSVGRTPRLSAV